MNAKTFQTTPGYPLSGAIVMCGAQSAAARKRVHQLAPIAAGVQGIGVRNADLTVDAPTNQSASTSERSPG